MADHHWDRRYDSSTKNWYLEAFNLTKADTSCASDIGAFYKGDWNWNKVARDCTAILW